MDRTGSNFYRCVDMIVDRLGAVPMVLQLPLGGESDFAGVIDLVAMKAVVWEDESLGAKFVLQDIPADYADKAAVYREKLVELAVEQDDAAMEASLDGPQPNMTTPKLGLHQVTCRLKLLPVACVTETTPKDITP